MLIKEKANEYSAYIIEQRRYFHQNPELAFKEFGTTAHIEAELEKMGIETQCYDDITGVVGTLKGGKAGKTIAIRADMDALPGVEETGLPFAPTNGNMHACGHDGHMAGVLGAARILSSMRDELCGTVKFLFQPAEEASTGGPVTRKGCETGYGSEYLTERGALDGVDATISLHIWSEVPVGTISVDAGIRMAAKDSFTITVKGLSAHGAAPQNGHDALLAASAIVVNLQTLVSRLNDPRNMLAMTVGRMRAGTAPNSVAGEALMEGTARTFSAEFHDKIEPLMRNIITHTAEAMGCTAELKYVQECNPVSNDDALLNALAQESAEEVFGADHLYHMEPATASEDFSYYATVAPTHYAFVGAKDPANGMVYANHHTKFYVNEETLKDASAYLATLAYKFLRSE